MDNYFDDQPMEPTWDSRDNERMAFEQRGFRSNVPPQMPSRQNSALSLTQRDLDYLVSSIGQNLMQYISQQARNGRTPYGDKTPNFEKNVLGYLEKLFNGLVTEDPTTGKKYYVFGKVMNAQSEIASKLEILSSQIQTLQKVLDHQTKVMEEQALIIKRQHDIITRYENDVIYKTQKDLIMELIGIADQLRFTMNDHMNENNFESLFGSIKDLREWVDGSLQAVAVRPYVAQESKEFDSKRQEVVEVLETNNPEENGLIKSVLPGYIWSVPLVGSNELQQRETLPKKYEFMIRPEQVARLKFVEKKNETANECISDDSHIKDVVNDAISSVESNVGEVERRESDYNGSKSDLKADSGKGNSSFWSRLKL